MLSLKQRVQYLQYKQSVSLLCAIPPHAAKSLPAAPPVDRHTANATPPRLFIQQTPNPNLGTIFLHNVSYHIPRHSEPHQGESYTQIIATVTIPARVQFYLPDPQMVRMPWNNTSGESCQSHHQSGGQGCRCGVS